jgi:hypothetical protein
MSEIRWSSQAQSDQMSWQRYKCLKFAGEGSQLLCEQSDVDHCTRCENAKLGLGLLMCYITLPECATATERHGCVSFPPDLLGRKK